MRNVKCKDCEEYRNQWCEKVIDSPHPDILRDCQYFHERDKDIVKVVRCKDCKYYNEKERLCNDLMGFGRYWNTDDFCSKAEKKDSEENNGGNN